MPIYAYKCASCGFAQDALQKISDPPLTVCPQCGASALVKQVTAAGFQLKGSGWYVTDFRGGGGASQADKGQAKPEQATGEAKPETKSGEAKADAQPASQAAPAASAAPAPAKPASPAPGGAAGQGA